VIVELRGDSRNPRDPKSMFVLSRLSVTGIGTLAVTGIVNMGKFNELFVICRTLAELPAVIGSNPTIIFVDSPESRFIFSGWITLKGPGVFIKFILNSNN
jgi:hypothetical protein